MINTRQCHERCRGEGIDRCERFQNPQKLNKADPVQPFSKSSDCSATNEAQFILPPGWDPIIPSQSISGGPPSPPPITPLSASPSSTVSFLPAQAELSDSHVPICPLGFDQPQILNSGLFDFSRQPHGEDRASGDLDRAGL